MRKIIPASVVLIASLLATQIAMAAVSAQEAAKLGSTLTPLGAQKEGNANGSIPAWTGGLPKNAGTVDAKGFLSDPFAAEKPLFVISAANLDQYRDKLTAGQQAMFKRYPQTYRIPVYASHRTVTVPDKIAAGAKQCAQVVEEANDGAGLKNFADCGRLYAFPLPKNGVEVVWNHVTRYQGDNFRRWMVQATPQVDGSFTPVRLQDEQVYPHLLSDYDKGGMANVMYYATQRVLAPARLAGDVALVHETIDQVAEPRLAWLYNAGSRRVRRAPQVAYDGPGSASDGLRTADNYDLFNGAPDRYDWKLIGKKEMYIPYNNYRLEDPKLKYGDIIKAGHINQDLTRYELHRVWEVEATVKPTSRHIYAKRHMYFDEDSWQLAAVDHYDGRGQLWRVAEGHALYRYDQQADFYAAETLYDLIAGRYVVLGLRNEEHHNMEFGFTAKAGDYTPAALRSSGMR